MMGANVFLDTHVLYYAALGRRSDPEKHAAARRIIVAEDYCTSAQVLAEFYTNVTKTGAPPLSPERAQRWVQAVAKKPCQPVDGRVVTRGIEISQRYGLSYWDGAILAAAERLNVQTVYTEDLNHGQTYGSVRVCNPFIDDFLA